MSPGKSQLYDQRHGIEKKELDEPKRQDFHMKAYIPPS